MTTPTFDPYAAIDRIGYAVAGSMPDPADVLDRIGSAVSGAMDPGPENILRAIYDGTRATNVWTVLPPGSHLWLYSDKDDQVGHRGVGVIAIREHRYDPDSVQTLTERGDWFKVTPDTRVVIGGTS